jgi:hypothetical protein
MWKMNFCVDPGLECLVADYVACNATRIHQGCMDGMTTTSSSATLHYGVRSKFSVVELEECQLRRYCQNDGTVACSAVLGLI